MGRVPWAPPAQGIIYMGVEGDIKTWPLVPIHPEGPPVQEAVQKKKREKQNKTLVQKFAGKKKKALKFKAPGLCPAYSEE